MSSSFGRVGKALVKYFKPIVLALPHIKGQPRVQSTTQTQAQNSFQLLRFKKPKLQEQTSPDRDKAPASINIPEAETAAPAPSGKTPAHWIELVLYLLGACRRLSLRMRQKVGFQTYQAILTSKGKQKLKTVGSIIDATPVIQLDEPKDPDQESA